jgi:hypothetical protein
MLPSNIRPLLRPMRIVLDVLAVFVLVQVVLCIPPSYEVRIGSLARSGTSRVIARCWECELVCRILHPSFPALGWSIAQEPLLVPALALRPPQLHHNCVAVPSVRWGFTAVGDIQRPLRFGPWSSMAVNRRFRDKSENHGAPGSNPGHSPAEAGDALRKEGGRGQPDDPYSPNVREGEFWEFHIQDPA